MKLSRFLPICLSLIASAVADGQVATPSVGYVRYANDEIRAIYGLEGNYVVADKVVGSAQAASFSDDGGVISQSGSLVLLDANLSTVSTAEIGDPDAVIRMDGKLEMAIAWLPASHALVHWDGKSFVRTVVPELSGEGTVSSVRKLDKDTVSLLVLKPDSTIVRHRISLETAQVKGSMAPRAACGFAFEDGSRIFCFEKGKLSIFSQMGETLGEIALPVEDGLLIEQASTRCLHLSTRTPGQDWLLHTDDKDVHLYQLPRPREATPAIDYIKAESAK